MSTNCFLAPIGSVSSILSYSRRCRCWYAPTSRCHHERCALTRSVICWREFDVLITTIAQLFDALVMGQTLFMRKNAQTHIHTYTHNLSSLPIALLWLFEHLSIHLQKSHRLEVLTEEGVATEHCTIDSNCYTVCVGGWVGGWVGEGIYICVRKEVGRDDG